jgi:general secretion pathway protein G
MVRTSNSSAPRSRRRGFTLVELLVVIGIIVLLASIALPMVLSARRNASRVRAQSDLNTVAVALEAYKADFKDYPRPDPTQPTAPVLAWALLGPWQAATDGSNPGDGADGYGFRTSWDNTNKVGSKVYGPYLSPEKFRTQIVPKSGNETWPRIYLLDQWGSKIEYLPRWRSAQPGRPLFGVSGGGDPCTSGITGGGADSVYDCRQASDPRAVYYFQRALGDGAVDPYTHDDLIKPGAGEKYLQDPPPFLLMSLSYAADFSIGPTYANKTDVDKKIDDPKAITEVTNLHTP